MWEFEVAVVVAMVAINSIFAAFEIALASVSLPRLKTLAREKRRGAGAALRMKQDIEGSLAVVQLGITLVGAIAAATGGASAEEQIAPWLLEAGMAPALIEPLAIVLVVLPLTALTIVFGELLPKLFALRNAEWVCLRMSTPMSWLSKSVWPAVWVLESSASGLMNLTERMWKPRVSEDGRTEAAELQELKAVAQLARTARLIGRREENIILNAARLSSRTVREILLPAEHISMLDADASIATCLIAAHLDMHTRFPVTEKHGDPQGIIGYVNFKDIIAPLRDGAAEPKLRSIMRNVMFLPDDAAISSALESLMRARSHIAIIRERQGKVLGLITLEDIIEEMVGDIQDEYDLLPVHVVPTSGGWIVGGGVALDRLHELTGVDLSLDQPPSGPARHLSAWAIGHLGHPSTGGETLMRHGVRVALRKLRRQQVLEAHVSRIAAPSGTAAAAPPDLAPAPDATPRAS